MGVTADEYNRVRAAVLRERDRRKGHRDATENRGVEPAMVVHVQAPADLPTYSIMGLGSDLEPRPLVPTCEGLRPKLSPLWLASNGKIAAKSGTRIELRAVTGSGPLRVRLQTGEIPSVGERCGPRLDGYTITRRQSFFVMIGRDDHEDDVGWVAHTTRFQGLVGEVVQPARARQGTRLGYGVIFVHMRDPLTSGTLDASALPDRIGRLPFWNHTPFDTATGDLVRVKATIGVGLTLENPCDCLD